MTSSRFMWLFFGPGVFGVAGRSYVFWGVDEGIVG